MVSLYIKVPSVMLLLFDSAGPSPTFLHIVPVETNSQLNMLFHVQKAASRQ